MKLRNSHRDALRRQKRLIKSGAAEIKLWKFQSQMEFLLRYMFNENRETNSTYDDNHSEPPQDQSTESDNQHSDDQTTFAEGKEELVQPNTANADYFDSSANEPVESPTLKKNPKKKLKKIHVYNLTHKTFEQREQRLKERAEERKKLEERNAPTDDLYLFYMSMYELTKKMPPSSQHIVRRNVFLAVSQEEAHLLNISE